MDMKQFLPVPDLTECRSILCIQPHPDDNEVGAGGTIALLAAKGAAIHFVTVTDGGMGTMDPSLTPKRLAAIRRAETEASGRLLGVGRYFWLDYPDGRGLNAPEVRDALVGIIRETRPQAVLAPDPWLSYEGHSDHRITGLAAVEACLFSPFPNCGSKSPEGREGFQPEMVVLYNTSRPNTWVDVGSTWATKIEALKSHRSQFAADWDTLAFFFEARARSLAEGHGMSLAETFKVVPPVLLHAMTDTEDY